MRPKPNKQNIIDEVIELIRVSTNYNTALAQIGAKWHISKRTFDRYWKTAGEQHIEAKRPIKNKKEALDTKKAINTCVKLNITIERIATVLLDILENKKANVKPADQIAAGKQLCVMFGFNEPSKTDVSISGDVKTVIQLFADQPPLVE